MNFTVLFVTVMIYSGLGFVFGFAMASHNDILNGVRPQSKNKLIMFICRPTNEIIGLEKVIFSAGIIIWTLSFFALIAVPIILTSKYVPEFSEYVIYALVPLILIGKLVGSRSWNNVPKKT